MGASTTTATQSTIRIPLPHIPMRQVGLALLGLSSAIPFVVCGRWPTHSPLQDPQVLVYMGVLLAIVFGIAMAMPLVAHYVLEKVSGKQSTWTQAQLDTNAKRRSQRLALTSITTGIVTSSQVIAVFIWAFYVGQMSFTIVDLDNIISLVGPRSLPVLILAWLVKAVAQVWVMLLMADITFYGFHCLSHENKWLWKTMHYLHHENVYPENGFFTLHYVHALEALINNTCFTCGLVAFKCDLGILSIYGTMTVLYVAAGHSGLDLSHLPVLDYLLHPDYHALHHTNFKVNYSEHFTIVDKIFGTYMKTPATRKQA